VDHLSQIAANFHDPEHFGHLVLSPTPEILGKLSDEFRKGGLDGPIQVFGRAACPAPPIWRLRRRRWDR